MNPIEYLIENISWYAPIYNISWVMFMVFALTLPVLTLGFFHWVPALRRAQPPADWATHRRTYGYLVMAALVIFGFRLIPYWIFNDKILHFLGGGISIGLIYEYFVLNFRLNDGEGMFSFAHVDSRSVHWVANALLLALFISFFSVFSELYEFVSKYVAGAEFDSSGMDTWLDILNNTGGAYVGYTCIWLWKYAGKRPWTAESS